MKILFCAINSKFIHSSLAPWYLSASVEKAKTNISSDVFEATINEDNDKVFEKLKSYEFDVIGFSTYIWNKNYILKLAEKIKNDRNAIVVFGGPEVSYNAKEILRKYTFVDYVVSGEGERAFFEVANGIPFENINGFCYRKNNEIVISEASILEEDPPFPYSQKYFSTLNGRIAYLETSRGCPFHCAFCLSGRLGTVRFFDLEESKRKILLLANSGTQTVKFIDRTFNADKNRAKEIFRFIIDNFGKNIPTCVCFHFEIEGELVDDEMIEILSKAPEGLFQFEIGLQSFNEKTLQYINRRTNLKKLTEIIEKLISLGNIHIHIDLIAGMSFESYESFEDGFNKAIALRPHMLQLGFLKLLYGTDMREDTEKYKFECYEQPPYEVYATEWMSKKDLINLHILEEVVEKLYNSGRFPNTCEYLFSKTKNVFKQLMEFSFYYNSSRIENNLDAFTKCVFDFFPNMEGVDKNVLRDKLAMDRLSTNKMGTLPEFLKIHSPIIKKMLNDLEKAPNTRREKGIKRAATILLSEPKFVYVDYKNHNKVDNTFKINKISIKNDEI